MRKRSLLLAFAVAAAGLALHAAPAPTPLPSAAQPADPSARKTAGEAAGTQVQPPAIDPDGVLLAGADARGVRTPSAPHAWGGVREGTKTLSDRVVGYRIEATLDPKKHIVAGRETLTWKNRSAQPIKSVYLHLYLNAFESTGSTFMRELGPGAFRGLSDAKLKKGEWGHVTLDQVQQQGGAQAAGLDSGDRSRPKGNLRDVRLSFVHPDGGADSDHTVARLDLPEAVPPGGTTDLEIAFTSQLPRVIARTGYYGSYHLVGQWFPKIGVLEVPGERGATAPRWNVHEFHLNSEFYADYGTYDVKLTVPKGYTVGSTGKLQGAPLETPAGVVHHYKQDDVHDFAWTAWDGYAAELTAEWTHAGSPKVAVKVLYPPEYEASAQPTLKATLAALTWFSDTLGPYPYETVTAVIPPYGAEESGGMEYPTFFTNIGQKKPDPGMPLVEFVAVHEFGHGYFYGILGNNEFEEPVLDEGLNEFWDTRMMEKQGWSFKPALPRIGRLKNLPAIPWSQMERLGGSSRTTGDTLADSAWHRLGGIGYVYAGTAVWFHDLEERLGGDVLARAFKEYYRRWKFRHPSTADLRAVLEEVSGDPKTIGEFFDEHVFGQRGLDDRVVKLESVEKLPLVGSVAKGAGREELDREGRDKVVKAAREAWSKANGGKKRNEKGPGPYPFETTVTVRRHGAAVPQTLLVKFADGSEQRLPWPAGEAWKKFTFVTPTRLASAQLDPEGKLHADANKLDDGKTIEAAPLAGRRWTLEIGSWVQLGLAVLEAL